MSQEKKYYFCGSYLTPCCLILLINFILFCLLVKVSRKPRYQIKGFIIGISQVIVLAHSHCTGTGPGQVQGIALGLKNTLYRNVHTGPRQGQETRPIVSYWVSRVSGTCPDPISIWCE